jgi:fructose-1,6-bisphosphatase
MTISIQQVANTSTFYFWKTQTNLIANALSTVVLTTNANTVGNANLQGTFTTTNLNSNNVSVTGTATLKRVIANNSSGSAGQILTSNGTSTYWSTIVGTITQVNTAAGIIGGPITSTGTISLDLYSGSSAVNTNYPVGTTVSVYTGTNAGGQRTVATTETIYTDNLNGIAGASGSPLIGTWRNRGLCGTDYRSPSEIRYYYLYQRVV